jgi:hypothetical protein
LAEQYQWDGVRLKILLHWSVRLKSLLHSCEMDKDRWQFDVWNLSCLHLMKIQCVDWWCLHLAEWYQWGGMRLKILLCWSVRLKSLLHSHEVDEDGWQFDAWNLSHPCLMKIQCVDWWCLHLAEWYQWGGVLQCFLSV